MDVDWNVLLREWSDTHFQVSSVITIKKGNGELWTSYRTVKPSFTVIKRGQGILLLDEHTYELQPGVVVFSRPGMWLKAWDTGKESFECYRVLFEDRSFESTYSRQDYGHYKLVIGENPRIYMILDQMCEVVRLSDIQSEFQLKTLFYQFLNELRISSKKKQRMEHRAIIEESISYINLHLHESHSLFSLASRCGLSSNYFSELFAEITGFSPINYIIRHRLKTAEQMLLTTNTSIREIGRSVGYSDPYQFSKIFKKYKGVAPSAYRSENGKEGRKG